MRISDWSSDVCSSDLPEGLLLDSQQLERTMTAIAALPGSLKEPLILRTIEGLSQAETALVLGISEKAVETRVYRARARLEERSEEHTSELQSLMRISYTVFCLAKKKTTHTL